METVRYVVETLDAPLGLRPVSISHIPYFLQDRYRFLEGKLLSRDCVFAVPFDAPFDPPALVAKHVSQIEAAVDATVIVLLPTLTASNRKRLIHQGVSFIVPGSQLFLPELAIDLRDHYRAKRFRPPEVETLSPTAQVLILTAALHDGRIDGLNAAAIADAIKVSPMSISRAMEELRGSQLADIETAGRQTRLYPKLSGKALFEAAAPRLRNPVRKVRGLLHLPTTLRAPLAGESALARYTSLNEPRTTTLAVPARAWKEIAPLVGEEIDLADNPPVRIETWDYDPFVLTRGGDVVDPLSLFLSLKAEDERMELAREQLLEIAFP